MTDPIQFHVPGKATGQGDLQAYVREGKVRLTHKNPRLKEWRAVIALFARAEYRGPLLTGPVAMEVTFWFTRPKNHFGTGKNAARLKPDADVWKHTRGRDDIDKLERALLDALTGIIYEDDGQVCKVDKEKRYGASPGIDVKIWEPT